MTENDFEKEALIQKKKKNAFQ